MDDLRPMPAMHVEDDWFSIYECMECGAVVRDPDTHVGWHASRHYQNGSAGWSETVVATDGSAEGRPSVAQADIVTRLRGMADDQAAHRTHYNGCAERHIGCAALLVCDEIERLRAIARYAEHRDNCEQPYSVSQRVCNCGLSNLLEARRG